MQLGSRAGVMYQTKLTITGWHGTLCNENGTNKTLDNMLPMHLGGFRQKALRIKYQCAG